MRYYRYHIYIYIYIFIFLFIFIFIYLYIYIFIYLYLFIYIYIYICIYLFLYLHVRTHTHFPRCACGMDLHGRSWASLKSGRKSQNETLLEEDGEITRSPGAGPCSMERWLALDNSASGVIKHGWETPEVNGGYSGETVVNPRVKPQVWWG